MVPLFVVIELLSLVLDYGGRRWTLDFHFNHPRAAPIAFNCRWHFS